MCVCLSGRLGELVKGLRRTSPALAGGKSIIISFPGERCSREREPSSFFVPSCQIAYCFIMYVYDTHITYLRKSFATPYLFIFFVFFICATLLQHRKTVDDFATIYKIIIVAKLQNNVKYYPCLIFLCFIFYLPF